MLTHTHAHNRYCVAWPAAMDFFLKMASVFALDLFEPARLPCIVTGYSYSFRVWVAILAPPAFSAAAGLAGVAYAACSRKQRRARATVAGTALRPARGADGSVVRDGLWRAAPVAFFVLDLMYPTVTRVLCQYFTCRNLGAGDQAEHWLEADYAISPV